MKKFLYLVFTFFLFVFFLGLGVENSYSQTRGCIYQVGGYCNQDYNFCPSPCHPASTCYNHSGNQSGCESVLCICPSPTPPPGGTYRCRWTCRDAPECHYYSCGTDYSPGYYNCRFDCPSNDNCSYYNQTDCETRRVCPCETPAPVPTGASIDFPALYRVVQPYGGFIQLNSNTTPGYIVTQLIKYLFPIAGLILLLIIIYGGYNMMLSGGDPKKAALAKSILTTGLLGMVIIFTAYWIVQIIANILGIPNIINTF